MKMFSECVGNSERGPSVCLCPCRLPPMAPPPFHAGPFHCELVHQTHHAGFPLSSLVYLCLQPPHLMVTSEGYKPRPLPRSPDQVTLHLPCWHPQRWPSHTPPAQLSLRHFALPVLAAEKPFFPGPCSTCPFLSSRKLNLVTQLCLTLGDPMDCSPPGSSVHGNLQARVLEWVAIIIQRWAQKGLLPPLHPFLPPASPFALIPLDYFPFGSLTYFLFTCFLVYCFSPPVNCEPLVGWNIDHLAPFCLGLEHTRS